MTQHVAVKVQTGTLFDLKDLKRAWNILRTVIPRRSALPILDMVLFERVNARWSVKVTDLETTISVALHKGFDGYSDKSRISFLVPFHRMSKLLGATRTGSLRIEPYESTAKLASSSEEFRVRIHIGRGTYSFVSHDPTDYPATPALPPYMQKPVAILQQKFIVECKQFVMPCIGQDALRPSMMAAYLDLDCKYFSSRKDPIAAVVATDGHRLALNPVHHNDGVVFGDRNDPELVEDGSFATTKHGFHLPLALFQNANKLRSDEISIYTHQGHATFACGDVTIVWRLIDDAFPNYAAIIPINDNMEATIEAGDILDVLRRLETTCSSMTWQSRWTFGPEKLTFHSEDIERSSEGEESIPCVLVGDSITMGFNLLYAQNVFRGFGPGAKLKFCMSSPNRACRVEEDNGDKPSRLFLLMPVMLNTYS